MNRQNLKCLRCESNNIHEYIIQIRHDDERESRYYTCLDCDYIWRQSIENPNT